jgi:hypothetical protein
VTFRADLIWLELHVVVKPWLTTSQCKISFLEGFKPLQRRRGDFLLTKIDVK